MSSVEGPGQLARFFLRERSLDLPTTTPRAQPACEFGATLDDQTYLISSVAARRHRDTFLADRSTSLLSLQPFAEQHLLLCWLHRPIAAQAIVLHAPWQRSSTTSLTTAPTRDTPESSAGSGNNLIRTCTAGGVLFDPKFTDTRQPSPRPHYLVYTDPTSSRVPPPASNMDAKRHPSSFQQLEKLGEGTYATVRLFFYRNGP